MDFTPQAQRGIDCCGHCLNVLRRWGLTPWTRRPVQPLSDRWPTGIVCSNRDYHRLRRLKYRTTLHCGPGASASKLDTAEHAMLLENEAPPNVMCIVLNADTYHILAYKIEGRSFDVPLISYLADMGRHLFHGHIGSSLKNKWEASSVIYSYLLVSAAQSVA